MNITLDWFNKWAERLTIRLMRLFGASESSINAVADGFENRESSFNEADNKLKQRGKGLKYLIMIVIIAGVVFISLKIKKLIK